MTDLVGFLESRLDEDETAARNAAFDGGDWDTSGPGYPEAPEVRVIDDVRGDLFETENVFIADHIAAWDPARVLAEIDAKRAHIALWREANEWMSAAIEKQRTATNDLAKKSAMLQRERALGFHEATVRMLQLDVAIYASHEDFDESWRT